MRRISNPGVRTRGTFRESLSLLTQSAEDDEDEMRSATYQQLTCLADLSDCEHSPTQSNEPQCTRTSRRVCRTCADLSDCGHSLTQSNETRCTRTSRSVCRMCVDLSDCGHSPTRSYEARSTRTSHKVCRMCDGLPTRKAEEH